MAKQSISKSDLSHISISSCKNINLQTKPLVIHYLITHTQKFSTEFLSQQICQNIFFYLNNVEKSQNIKVITCTCENIKKFPVLYLKMHVKQIILLVFYFLFLFNHAFSFLFLFILQKKIFNSIIQNLFSLSFLIYLYIKYLIRRSTTQANVS